ncbi:hypothetical protein [Embleya sp. NBC_00896]|uniref:hypothetical protein n=1 Tax=Embleya sp. NBC_00896 TaxID=2975961 RepID=UPI00386C0A8C|nr:hypothetical protein OG928_24980 [Embleya sp. NBC_00896]
MTAVTVGALMLVACNADGKDDKKDSPKAAGTPASTAPVVAPDPTGSPAASGSGQPKAPKSAKPSAGRSSAAAPGDDCGAGPTIKTGHKIVYPVRQPTKDSLYYKNTKFVCDPNDGHFEAVGAEQTPLHFAPKATGTLNGPTPWKAEYLAQVWDHIGKCLANQTDGEYMCSSNGAYDITLNAANEITDITEIFHS